MAGSLVQRMRIQNASLTSLGGWFKHKRTGYVCASLAGHKREESVLQGTEIVCWDFVFSQQQNAYGILRLHHDFFSAASSICGPTCAGHAAYSAVALWKFFYAQVICDMAFDGSAGR